MSSQASDVEVPGLDKRQFLLDSWKRDNVSVAPDTMLLRLKFGYAKTVSRNKKLVELHVPESYKSFDSLTEKQIGKVCELWTALNTEEKQSALLGKALPASDGSVVQEREEDDNDKAHALNLMSISNSALREAGDESKESGTDATSEKPDKPVTAYNEEVGGKTREEQLREAARIRQRRKRERDRELLIANSEDRPLAFSLDGNKVSRIGDDCSGSMDSATTRNVVGADANLPNDLHLEAAQHSAIPKSVPAPGGRNYQMWAQSAPNGAGTTIPSVNVKRFRALPIDWENTAMTDRVAALGHLATQTVCRHSALEAIDALKDIAYGLN